MGSNAKQSKLEDRNMSMNRCLFYSAPQSL